MSRYISREIPADLRQRYTMGGTIPVYDWFLDDRVSSPVVWSKAVIEENVATFTFERIKAGHAETYYAGATRMVVQACERYPFLRGKAAAVIGSQTPWLESILINNGSSPITTVDYNKPECDDPRLRAVTYEEFSQGADKYAAIFSYSSIEHSGLGRYGDPLDPDGDLEAAQVVRRSLVDGGYFFLGVPVGRDGLSWNAHRVYGAKRLPLLFRGFEEIEWIGLDRNFINVCAPDRNGPQPLVVLKKKAE